jgi:MYXO-CTERM domain-containing protein
MLPFTRARAIALASFGLLSLTSAARAELLFKGDLETGDFEQFSYLLKEEGLSIATDQVAEGKNAGKITISNKELWDNGLNRVEVNYQPDDAHLTEGKDIYYAFSFYLPEALTTDNHQILYWETNGTYQQLMQLAVEGEKMRFATQKPAWKVHWEAEGMAKPGKWHRVAIHVKWSADANVGQVDLWFNGTQVVTAGKAQTFVGNTAFVQHGILRDTIDKVETLYFDDARAGTTLEDVLMPAGMPSGGGGGMGGMGTGGGGMSAGGSSSGGSSSGGSSSGGNMPLAGASSAGAATGGTAMAAAGAAPTAGNDGSDSSCSVSSKPSGFAAALVLLAALGLGRRRRS